MADAKTTELTEIDAIADADLVPVVDDVAGTPVTKKSTFAKVWTWIQTKVLPISAGGTGASSLAAGLIQSNGTVLSTLTPGSGMLTWIATPSGANLASALTSALPNTKGGTGQDSSGWTGLASVSSGTWSALTLGSGVATFLGTPSSANLAAAVTGETGSGALVFATSPSLTTPDIGAATGTSLALSSGLIDDTGGGGVTLAVNGTTRAWVTDAGFKLNDGGGQYAIIAVANIAADRTVTIPALSGDDDFVFVAHAQTLTNKTVSGPSFAASSFLSTGATPADAGAERHSNNTSINFRNQANSANVQAVYVNTSNEVWIGTSTNPSATQLFGTGTLGLNANAIVMKTDSAAADIASFTATAATLKQTSVSANGNARAQAFSDIANIQTTDATVTTLFSFTPTDEAVTMLTVEVLAVLSTGAETNAYVRRARIKRDGGTVTVATPEETFTDEETAAWDCTIDNSGTTVRVRVTGEAAHTIDWGCVATRLVVTHA